MLIILRIQPDTEVRILTENINTGLHNYELSSLPELEELYLPRNGLKKIHKDAFSNLKYLSLIDMSRNMIQYIGTDFFHKIQIFKKLFSEKVSESFPYFISTDSNKLLDLSYCNIPALSSNMFDRMPSLHYLYLRGNQQRKIKPKLLDSLSKFNTIDPEDNPWSCSD